MTAETVSDEDVGQDGAALDHVWRLAEKAEVGLADALNRLSESQIALGRAESLAEGLRCEIAALATDRAARPIDWPRVRVAVQSQSVATAVRKVLAECGHMASDATALAVADAVVQAAARGKEAGR